MTVHDTMNFVTFNPLQSNNPSTVRYCKLMAKIDEQIQLMVLSDKCEPVSEWPVTVALCRTELAPLGESGGAVKLEIGP